MSRSVWKGPFFDGYLLKKAEAARASGRNDVINLVGGLAAWEEQGLPVER